MNITSSPEEVETSTHLTSELGTGAALDHQKWFNFLNELQSSLSEAIEYGTTSQLKIEQREELLRALNANPLKQEIFLEISDQGDLISESETKKWQEI